MIRYLVIYQLDSLLRLHLILFSELKKTCSISVIINRFKDKRAWEYDFKILHPISLGQLILVQSLWRRNFSKRAEISFAKLGIFSLQVLFIFLFYAAILTTISNWGNSVPLFPLCCYICRSNKWNFTKSSVPQNDKGKMKPSRKVVGELRHTTKLLLSEAGCHSNCLFRL